MVEDKFIKYLTDYYNKHKTINDIPRDSVVIFEGQPLKIGEFLASIRKQHRLFLAGDGSRGSMSETSLIRYQKLDSLSFEWEPGKKKQQNLENNDVCMLYIEEYYKKNKTLAGIPDTITINGEEYSIRNFFSHIRANHKKYISGKNSKGSNSPTAQRRYDLLGSMGINWEPLETRKSAYEICDKYMSYIEAYYNQHSTLDGLPKIAIYDGVELNIENFLTDRRANHKRYTIDQKYKPSELELVRWSRLDKLSFDWAPRETKHQEQMTNDKYIRYLRKHYQEHKTINDIKAKQEVEFEGEILKIGDFLSEMRKKHFAYTSGKEKVAVGTELMLKRYKELEEMEIDWRPSESRKSIAELEKTSGIKRNRLRKYIQRFNGDIEKAIKICQASAKHKEKAGKKAKKTPTLTTIAQEFEIDLKTLEALLNRSQLIIKRQPRKVLMYDENTNLRQYCLDNGLNYTVIQKAIKLRMKGLSGEDLQSLINRCICEYQNKGQQRPSTWIYSKYGNEILVTHLLTYLNLDPEAILHDMSANCVDIYQAIENNSFQRSSKQQYDYLEFIYHDVVKFYKEAKIQETDKVIIATLTSEHLQALAKEYYLTSEETRVIEESLNRYVNAVRGYHLFDVGFEKDESKRIEKILEHKLDESEVEEAFFMPLNFDRKALIGRHGELYERRVILKNLTASWGNLTEEARQEASKKYNLTYEEFEYITTTRKNIDQTKRKVFKKQ